MPLWWEKRDAPLLLARWKWRSLGSPLSSFDPHRGVVPHYLLVEVGVQVPTRPFAGILLTAGGGALYSLGEMKVSFPPQPSMTPLGRGGGEMPVTA